MCLADVLSLIITTMAIGAIDTFEPMHGLREFIPRDKQMPGLLVPEACIAGHRIQELSSAAIREPVLEGRGV